MAMSSGGNGGGPMSEINVTPLVDVMLVLLIIFMITAPLMSHKIKVQLPDANPKVTDEAKQAQPVDLAIKEDGSAYWNDNAVSAAELKAKLAVAASQSPQPVVQIRAAKSVKYKVVRQTLQDAKAAGIVHVGFMTTGAKNGNE
ncbi:biopolymer transporter ExbD [Oleiagrimonas sp. C23AA]|uniref:ExbD/TolR family protein n=1 Tax=Oleiagrimonas sp. C23AA TaxID=2719047 RepID=UPI00141E9033|nr:biopolymer transporter ExbD [Oleiagrimonas sp. C23AA]NII10687.1 biopolymer transporter ExbD [Oleiagrimonas sp. C23AA]